MYRAKSSGNASETRSRPSQKMSSSRSSSPAITSLSIRMFPFLVVRHGPRCQPGAVSFLLNGSAAGVLQKPGDYERPGPVGGPGDHVAVPVPDLVARLPGLHDAERGVQQRRLGCVRSLDVNF